jgi:hypothetical protein
VDGGARQPNPKSEGRRPKEGRNPKSEIAKDMAARGVERQDPLWLGIQTPRESSVGSISHDRRLVASGFGLRTSFGLRPSDFGFHTRPLMRGALLIVNPTLSSYSSAAR